MNDAQGFESRGVTILGTGTGRSRRHPLQVSVNARVGAPSSLVLVVGVGVRAILARFVVGSLSTRVSQRPPQSVPGSLGVDVGEYARQTMSS